MGVVWYKVINYYSKHWLDIVDYVLIKGGLHLKSQKVEHIFVAVITFFPFLLCKYF